jgi:hypothetical protein
VYPRLEQGREASGAQSLEQPSYLVGIIEVASEEELEVPGALSCCLIQVCCYALIVGLSKPAEDVYRSDKPMARAYE